MHLKIMTALFVSTFGLFSGNRNLTVKIMKSVKLVDQDIGCIPNDDNDFNLSLTFKSHRYGIHTCYLAFTNTLVKSTSEFHNDSTYPTSYVFKTLDWNKTIMYSGATKKVEFTIPRKMITSKANMFYLYDEEFNNAKTSSTLYSYFFRLDIQYPTTYDLTTEGDIYRDGDGYTGAYIRDDTIYQNPYKIQHTGFDKNFTNPTKNRIPLRQMQLSILNYKKEVEAPEYGGAVLKVKNNLDDFPFFNLKTDGRTSWREVPIEFEESDESNLWIPRLKEALGVTMDGRTMKPQEEMNDNDLLTKDIYLPSVDAGEAKIFSFELVVSDTGPNGLDKWTYSFEVTKTENYVGSCISSNYCVVRE